MDTMMALTDEKEYSSSHDLNQTLSRAFDVIRSSVGEESPLAARLNTLRERLQHRRLQIAVLGQFKRGKSTFINALIGAPVLPTGVVPLTAVPTFIAWRAKPAIQVSFSDGRPPEQFAPENTDAIPTLLARFVTEEANPKNRLHVERVDLFYPAELLSDGTALIDTPGIGSTLAHNTETAFRVLPECDASLFIVSADPPITETEVTYLQRLKPKVGRTFFVINKIDYLGAEDRRHVVDFLRKVLEEGSLIKPDAPIFCASAQMALSAKQTNDDQTLRDSGLMEVEEHLLRFLAVEKTQTLTEAIRRKAADILDQAMSEVELRTQAFKIPLEDLQNKAVAFSSSLAAIEEQRLTVGDLMSGDKRRLVGDLEAQIDDFRGAALLELMPVIDTGLSLSELNWERYIKTEVPTTLERLFTRAAEQFVTRYSSQAETILHNYKRRIDELVEEVRHTAAETFDVVLAAESEPDAFRLIQDPYWVTERISSALIPNFGRFVDHLLPAGPRRRRRRRRIVSETKELIIRNAENLRWAILRGINETFRMAIGHFDDRLSDAVMAIKGVIEDALARRRDRSFSAEPVLRQLRQSVNALETSRAALAL
jgi:GTP-binding protein EngB required for normal cell division